MHPSDSVDSVAEKLRLDFYKLHYPNRKSPQTKNKPNKKMRSNSVVQMARAQHEEVSNSYRVTPKGSVRRSIMQKKLDPLSNESIQMKRHNKSSFQPFLKAKSTSLSIGEADLPFNSMKELDQMAKTNQNVRMALQKNKDEKIKMNRIILSHKQTEEIKLQYLRSKKEEIQQTVDADIKGLYEEFFKKDYEGYFGDISEEKFEERLNILLQELSLKVFQH